jgi:hypothetical protein
MNYLRVADLYSSCRQLHLSSCVLIDKLVPWYLFLILNEAKNLVRDGLTGGESLVSKGFEDLLPVGWIFFFKELDWIT